MAVALQTHSGEALKDYGEEQFFQKANMLILKTRYLFKKIRDTKRIFHEKMGSIKDGNGMDLTEAEDIKKRWQEHMEEPYKKDLHDPDNHDDVITHLEAES